MSINIRKIIRSSFLFLTASAIIPLTASFSFNTLSSNLKAYAETYENVEYTVNDDEITITGCNTEVSEISIPAQIDGMPVTSIASSAFWKNSNLTVIYIPETVTLIANSTFSSNSLLETINVDENNPVFSSKDGVLMDKDVTSVIQYPVGKTTRSYAMPDTVEVVNENAFASSKIKRISFSSNLKEIKTAAFSESVLLKDITLPASLEKISKYVFIRCTSMQNINVEEGNANYISQDGILYTKDMTQLIQYPCGKELTSFVIPDGVTKVAEGAFANTLALTDVTFPDGLKNIGESAFDSSSITSMNIPSSVDYIGKYAFLGCMYLKDITFNGDLQSLGEASFVLCTSLEKINIPEGVESLGMGTFSGCMSLSEVTLPNSLTMIGLGAFDSCISLQTISIPANVSTISTTAFSNCPSLTDIYLSPYIETLDDMCFGYIMDENYNPIPSTILTVHGYNGTVAETYANENGLIFDSLGDVPPPNGDLNRDGIISADEYKKITVTLFGQKKIGDIYAIDKYEAETFDTNEDGVINIFDKALMKKRALNSEVSD